MAAPSRRTIRYEEYASFGDNACSHNNLTNMKPVPNSTQSIANDTIKSGITDTRESDKLAHKSNKLNEVYMQEFEKEYKIMANKSAQSCIKEKVPDGGLEGSYINMTNEYSVTRTIIEHNKNPLIREETYKNIKLTGHWLSGPNAAEGQLYAVSERPLLCMSLRPDGNECVVGSSDHALYVIPLGQNELGKTRGKPTKSKTLYNKKSGHTEWVTCVTYTQQNTIVSGGMDSKLCVWDSVKCTCIDLLGHSGSISTVQNFPCADSIVVSGSYDKTLRLWDVKNIRNQVNECRVCVKVSPSPILEVDCFQNELIAAVGDRDGGVYVIDMDISGKIRWKNKMAHKGHITSLLCSLDNCIYTGGQDGILRTWDIRQNTQDLSRSGLELPLHTHKKEYIRGGGTGALTFIKEPKYADSPVLVTGGADGRVHVVDKRAWKVMYSFTEHAPEFIYALLLHKQLCISGAGNGMLLVHDWTNGTLLYGLGANKAAIRALAASDKQLIAAGDDGGVLAYSME